MESTDKLPETLEDLNKRRDELWAFLKPFRAKLTAATNNKEKKSLVEQSSLSYRLYSAIQSKIKELEQTASALSTAKATSNLDSQADVPTGTEAKPDEPRHGGDEGDIAFAADHKTDSDTNDQRQAATADDTHHKVNSPMDTDSANHQPGEHHTSDLAVDDEEVEEWAERPVDPPWILDSDVDPKEPRRANPNNDAVLRFIADGKVYCFGHLDRPSQDNVIRVLPIIKIPRAEPPFYGIRVKFPRDESSETKARFFDEKFHTVLYKFNPRSYTSVDDHCVTDDAEFDEFLKHAPEHVHAKAKEGKEQKRLYRVTFTYEGKGIEQLFYPNLYSSSVPEVQEIFKALELVPECKTLSIFMWKFEDLPGNLQYLYREQQDHQSSLKPYLHKHNMGMAAYVQWGKIKIPDAENKFDYWKTFRKYGDYNLTVGNGIVREKLKEVEIVKKIRNHPAKMTVIQADPDGDYYIALMQFNEFREAKKIIISAGKGLITWEPAPEVKPQSELAQGERPARDNPNGWQAWVITDSTINHGADVAFYLKRPGNPDNKYKDKQMPAVAKLGEVLQFQMVYYKIRVEETTTKQLLNGLSKLRFKETKGDPDAEIKRSVICGGDQTIHRTEDIFEGLSDADIASFNWDFTPSQAEFMFSYCRRILNGIGILQGPAGSGKTTIIKALVELANKRGLKVAIVTDSNSAADNVIDVIADKAYAAVRLHSLGLERKHLLGDSRKGIDRSTLRPADPEPELADDDDPSDKLYVENFNAHDEMGETGAEDVVVEASDKDDGAEYSTDATLRATKEIDAAHEEAQRAEGWQHDPLSITFTDFLMKSAQTTYENAKSIMSPEDPRMRMIDSALWTWILKVLGFIEKDKDADEVNKMLELIAADPIFKELRGLIEKSRTQELNRAEWAQYGNLVEQCATMFIKNGARATVCTIAQLANEWAKGVEFDWIITDEATIMTEGQFVQIWRGSKVALWIGDQRQLGPVTMTTAQENPFVDQLRTSPYVRFVENGWPFSMLREVMRMTAGLELICSEIFYSGQLKAGVSTALDHETRAMSRLWQEKTRSAYPSLTKEPPGLLYPVFINIAAQSQTETNGGTSRINLFNAAAVMDHVVWLVESKIARTDQIGIATPYAGQANLYLDLFRQLDKSTHNWQLLRVGSTEWWQGKQADCMVVDLVRASNDLGALGFMAEGRRLNVLLSRQKHALTIFGDKDCVKVVVTGDEKTDAKVAKNRDYDNRHLIKLFDWMHNKGRHVHVPVETLSQQYVSFAPVPAPAPASGPPSVTDNSGWGTAPASGAVEGNWDTAPGNNGW